MDTERAIHAVGAVIIGTVLAVALAWRAAAGQPAGPELAGFFGVVVGYFFGMGMGRRMEKPGGGAPPDRPPGAP